MSGEGGGGRKGCQGWRGSWKRGRHSEFRSHVLRYAHVYPDHVTWVTFSGVHLLEVDDIVHFEDIDPIGGHPHITEDYKRLMRGKNVGHKVLEVQGHNVKVDLDVKGVDQQLPDNNFPNKCSASQEPNPTVQAQCLRNGQWIRSNKLEVRGRLGRKWAIQKESSESTHFSKQFFSLPC